MKPFILAGVLVIVALSIYCLWIGWWVAALYQLVWCVPLGLYVYWKL